MQVLIICRYASAYYKINQVTEIWVKYLIHFLQQTNYFDIEGTLGAKTSSTLRNYLDYYNFLIKIFLLS